MNKKYRIVLNAPVTLCFVGMCFIVMCLSVITNGSSTEKVFMVYHSSLANPATYIRMFTHIFGHTNWTHLTNNMIFILILGPMLEEKYSSKVLIQVICITALITGLLNYILFPNTALCGASGICFALILMSSCTRFSEKEIPITLILVAVVFLGEQLYQGIAVTDNISNITHIVGGIVGGLTGFTLNKENILI